MLSRTKVAVCGVTVLLLAVAYDFNKRSAEAPPVVVQQDRVTIIDNEAWKKFTSANNEFSVLLPSLPQHVQEKVTLPNNSATIEYNMYLSQETDGTTFMISMIHYPQAFDTSKPDLLLQSVMKEMKGSSSTNELNNVEEGAFQSLPALDFSIRNKDFSIRCKAFLHNKTLFVLSIVDRTASGDIDVAFKKFVDSFEILDEQPKAPLLPPEKTSLPQSGQ